MGGKVKNKPITLKAFLIERKTGKIAVSKSFRNRLPIYLYVKLVAWVFAMQDDYPPSEYKLLVHIEAEDGDPRIQALVEQLRKSNIEVYLTKEVIASVVR